MGILLYLFQCVVLFHGCQAYDDYGEDSNPIWIWVVVAIGIVLLKICVWGCICYRRQQRRRTVLLVHRTVAVVEVERQPRPQMTPGNMQFPGPPPYTSEGRVDPSTAIPPRDVDTTQAVDVNMGASLLPPPSYDQAVPRGQPPKYSKRLARGRDK